MSRWFRHYAGMMRDDKLVRVAIKAGQPIERVVWIWGAILESAAEIDDGGRYDLDSAEIAYFLRADQADIDAVIALLEEGGRLLDSRVVKWGDRQFQSDRSTERQRRYRDRQKEKGDGGSGRKIDDDKTNSDAPVTSPSRHRDAPETETDTDIKPNGLSADAPEPVLDPRKLLFREGLQTLSRLTDRKPESLRSTLGRWMKLTGDDAGAVLSEIEKCRGSPPADPIAWIEARLKPKETLNGKPRRITSAEQAFASMGRVIASLNGEHQRDADPSGWGERDEGPTGGVEGLSGRLETPPLHRSDRDDDERQIDLAPVRGSRQRVGAA